MATESLNFKTPQNFRDSFYANGIAKLAFHVANTCKEWRRLSEVALLECFLHR